MNYLLLGPEEYLKNQFLKKLKNLKTGKTQPFDFDLFHAGEIELTKILDLFQTRPFISEKRLIVIKDIDRFSANEKDSILKYLRSPQDSTILVLESSSDNFDTFLEKVANLAKTVRCNRLKEKEINVWIKKEFALRKKHISIPCANLMRELTRSELLALENEIEKVASFAGDADNITESHIEAVLGKAYYKTAFEIVDLVLGKRIDKALQFLDDLLTKEKPHAILNLLGWQFRNFMKIKNMQNGLSIEKASQALDVSPWRAKKILEQEKHFTRLDVEKNLEIILEADFFIKTGKVDMRYALERALASLSSSV